MLARSLAVICSICAACAAEDVTGSALTQSSAFRDLNGVMWFYTTQNDTRFTALEASLDDWKARGIRVVGIYSPYNGAKEEWFGAAPLDFYSVPPQNGTLDDFRSLVEAAHARSMKVIAFMGFHSIDDERSALFATAEQKYRDGDRDAPEVRAFHWSDTNTGPTPTPAPYGPSAWKRSATAGAYYWALWDNAGFDINQPGAVDVMRSAIQFWVDVGIDGYMLDSGVVDPAFRPLWVDIPLAHTPDFWLTFESTQAWNAASYDEFGLTSWFAFEDNDYANTYSRVVMPESGEPAIDADGLERELDAVSCARSLGKLTHAWSLLERGYPKAAMRVQEAALLAGAGILYGAPMYDEHYTTWPAATRAAWERVLVATNAHAALWPSADRARVPTQSAATSYAIATTARDRGTSALLVYNLSSSAQDVTVDLAGTAIGLDQTPVDLVRGGAAAEISGPAYTLHLEAYGSALLGVATGADRRRVSPVVACPSAR